MSETATEPRFQKPLEQEVHRILWEEWDPYGVREIGGDDRTYEQYVLRVAGRVRSGEPAAAIARYLSEIRKPMKCPSTQDAVDQAVGEMLAGLTGKRDWQ